MKKEQKKSINTWTEANKVDKVLNSHLTRIGLSDEDFLMNFTFSESKERPDLAIKDKNWNFCIVFENKKDFKGLTWAKNQGLKYLKQLKDINSLSNKVLLVATNMTTFHVNEYEVIDWEIKWNKEINRIDSIDDITLEFIKNYTHPQKQEEEKLLSTDKLELKRMFDKINNDLRELSWLNIQDRLEITMAMLFLKLLKENNDFISEIDNYKQEKQDLIDELNILRNSVSEKTIINTFDAINRLYKEHFYFDIPKYKWKNFLLNLYNIIDTFHLSNYDLDIKWEAFEYFINYWNTKSNDMGQYFTPRHIVKFMINLVDLEFENNREKWFWKKYFDPTCWTWWFLIEIFKKIRAELIKAWDLTTENKQKLKQDSVFGNERTEQTCKIARMNMILTWDWHSNINNGDFLLIKDDIYRKGFFDVSIGNPPFWNNREWEFIDWFLKDVKNKWYSIILVPEWVLFKADKNFVEIRKHLLNKWKLLKVISLPQWIFLPYAWVKTNIIFWKNEIQDKDYDIEFIDIKNDWFSLDANRRQIQNSDLEEYFENKQNLIDKWQIWTVNSGRIYDKTKLNELELSKSKLELEEKKQKNKIETLKKQLKQIDDKIEKEQKEKRILELQLSFDELKKQIKKVNDKLKTFDINLVINRYKIQKEINKNIDTRKLSDVSEIISWYSFNADFFNKEWDWIPIIRIQDLDIWIWKNTVFWNQEFDDKFLIDNWDILLSLSWSFKVELWKWWKCLLNQRILKININENIIDKKLFLYLLKSKIDEIISKSTQTSISNVSINDIRNLDICIPSLEYQQEIIKQIEEYEKIISWAKQIIDTYKPEIEIKKYNLFEIWDLFNVIDWDRWENYPTKDEFFEEWYCLFLNTKNVLKDSFNFEEKSFITKQKDEILRNWKLSRWDIVLTTRWTLWNIAYYDENINYENVRINSWMVILRPNSNILHKYIIFLFQTNYIKNYIDLINSWSAQPQLPIKELKQIKIPLPTLEEQQEIVERIEREQALINANKEIIKIFDEKIRNIIQKIWNWE